MNDFDLSQGERQDRSPFGAYDEEKRLARLAFYCRATRVGVPLLVMTALMAFWSYPYFFFAELFGVSPQDAYLAISTGTGQQVLQICLSSFAFLVPFFLAAGTKDRKRKEILPFGKPKGRRTAYFFMGMGLCAFADVAVNIAGSFFESAGVTYEVTKLKDPPGWDGFLLVVFASAVVPAFVEEFALRGAVFGLLEPYGKGFAVVASAAIFGLMHGNFEQMPFAFLVGLALGFVRAKTDSLWLCMLIHFVNNLYATLQSQLAYYLPPNVIQISFIVFLTVSLVGAVLAVWAMRDESAAVFRFPPAKTPLSLTERGVLLVTSPTVVVFIGICLWESMLYFR